MTLERLSLGQFCVNCYILISDSGRAIVIDPGAQPQKIKKFLDKNGIKPSFILHTHAHFDHIGADNALSLPVYIHKDDFSLLKDPLLNLSQLFAQPFVVESEIVTFDSEKYINLDEISLKPIHTPGHTPGSVCFLFLNQTKKLLFSGDTLFCLGIGRTDFPKSSYDKLIKSIKEKLILLDEDTVVYPGHGPTTTIGKEKRENPFLR
jgi:glyoxylase-like metal-dependent hydrolase (beta-lactamase superfamily II)